MEKNPNITKYLNKGGYHDMNISEQVRDSYKKIHIDKQVDVKKEYAANRVFSNEIYDRSERNKED